MVYIDQAQQRETGRTFESNRVVTSKYNVITFLPIFLFEMFSRVAYLYFLLQARPGWGWGGGSRSCAAVVRMCALLDCMQRNSPGVCNCAALGEQHQEVLHCPGCASTHSAAPGCPRRRACPGGV